MAKCPSEYYRYLPFGPQQDAWGLGVSGAGYQPAPPGDNRIPQRRHPAGYFYSWQTGRVLNDYALVYLTHGQGEFESTPTGLVELQPGDALLLFPGVWHRYRADLKTGWGVYWVHFQGPMVDHLQRRQVIAPERAMLRIGLEEAILASFNRLLDGLRTEPAGVAPIVAANTWELLARIVGAAAAPRTEPRVVEMVRNARLMLEEDPNQLPVVDELIARLDAGRTQFFRVFKEQTGLTPYQYHLHLTMRRAAEMLRSSKLPVKQIARALRFQDPYHFSKLFKKKTGMSPREYRDHWKTISR